MAQPTTQATANEAKSARYYEELWNRRNLDVIDDWIAPSFVGHYSGLPEAVHGVAGFRATVAELLEAFPDLRVTIRDMVSRDDKVVTRFSAQGTHDGPLQGFAPTGAAVTIEAIGIETYDNGKCVEEWAWFDDLNLARQIGAMPSPGTFAERAAQFMHRLVARRKRSKHGSAF